MDPRSRSQATRVLRPSWSGRNFELVLGARISMSAGRALAGVLVPIYLALQGFSAFELAEYVLVVAATSAVLSAVSGTLSDRMGRRPFLIGMPFLTAVAAGAFALTDAHALLFVMGALGSFGRGAGAGAGAIGPYQPAESAFVTDTLPARYRNDAFGRLTFGSSLGAFVGGLLALLVPGGHVHGAAATEVFRDGFVAVAVVSALAGVLAVGLVERPRPPRATTSPATGPQVRRSVWRLPRRSRWLLYRLWITNSLNGAAIGMFGPFVTYWFFRRFDASTGEVGVLFAVINVATMASSLSAAGLARRWGAVRTISVVRSAQALLLVPMVLVPNFALAGGIYLVRMVVQRIGLPLRQSYVVGLADPDERASVTALSNVPAQLAQAGIPLFTGYLFEDVSLSLPFEIAAAFQFLNAVTFWLFFRHHPPEEERTTTSPPDHADPRTGAPQGTT